MNGPPPLAGPEADAALARLAAARPLLAFDFDGTLAPIVPHPDRAFTLPALQPLLQALAARWPLAVVTGRAVHDVRPRLGFEPWAVVGNHGAEDEGPDPGSHQDPTSASAARDADAVLAPLRERLQRAGETLQALGLMVEDKGASLALHHRLSPRPDEAAAFAQRLAQEALAEARTVDGAGLRLFAGHCVLNAVPARAPDKADAVWRLARRVNADTVLFAGDDLNDEPVFERAAPHWLTVRLGAPSHGVRSAARWALPDPAALVPVFERLLALGGGGPMHADP